MTRCRIQLLERREGFIKSRRVDPLEFETFRVALPALDPVAQGSLAVEFKHEHAAGLPERRRRQQRRRSCFLPLPLFCVTNEITCIVASSRNGADGIMASLRASILVSWLTFLPLKLY